MDSERLASALSAVVLLALAGWLAVREAPPSNTKDLPVREKVAALTGRHAPQPAVAAVYLPPPPPPMLAVREQTMRSLPDKTATVSTVIPLAPAEPAAPKAVQSALRPLAPKTVSEAELPKSPQRAEPRHETAAAPHPETLREGRTLLRVLEHGSGPSIEIAWPDDEATRHRLYRRFADCFGMRIALMRGDGKLFTDTEPPGQPWSLNLDRFSGFVRKPAGRLVADEKRMMRRIRERHSGLHNASPVRVFPRRVDAVLLAGLKRISGSAYEKGRVIRARYRLARHGIVVANVLVGGVAVPGRVGLLSAGRGCRSRS